MVEVAVVIRCHLNFITLCEIEHSLPAEEGAAAANGDFLQLDHLCVIWKSPHARSPPDGRKICIPVTHHVLGKFSDFSHPFRRRFCQLDSTRDMFQRHSLLLLQGVRCRHGIHFRACRVEWVCIRPPPNSSLSAGNPAWRVVPFVSLISPSASSASCSACFAAVRAHGTRTKHLHPSPAGTRRVSLLPRHHNACSATLPLPFPFPLFPHPSSLEMPRAPPASLATACAPAPYTAVVPHRARFPASEHPASCFPMPLTPRRCALAIQAL